MGVPIRFRFRQWLDRSVVWPVADAFRFRGGLVALGTAVLCLGLGAWAAAMLNGNAPGPLARDSAAPADFVQPELLKGAAPSFGAGEAARAGTADPAPTQAAPAPQARGPLLRAQRTARTFSQAFLAYEVGRAGKATRHVFARTATPKVVESLGARPPRLPSKARVPSGRIRNVIVRKSGAAIQASVAIVRRGALGELRLTLRKTGAEWRVNQVRA